MSELWEQRFLAPRIDLPSYALDDPSKCIVDSDESGVLEIYGWDRVDGSRRQLTSRSDGTNGGVISHDGSTVWWFDDDAGSEHGVWRRQPFSGGEAVIAAPDVPAAYSAGMALHRDGTAVIGTSDDGGTTIYVVAPDGDTRILYSHEEDAAIIDISRDGTLCLLQHSEHGDSRHPALRVVRTHDGSTVADLWDGPGKGVNGLGFPDLEGDNRVLVGHERRGREEILVWDPITATEGEILIELDGDLSAQWWPDGRGLLIQRDHHGRSTLHRMLADGSLTAVGPATGVIADATVLPDGEIWMNWSSSAEPSTIIDSSGSTVITTNGPACPPSVAAEDVWVDGIHAFLLRPPGAAGQLPGVFVVHGGPEWHDEDGFRRDLAAFVDAGYAAVTVNYRGSTGYGSQWRDANTDDIGFVELADIARVREHLVATGVIDPTQVALTGGSWGGFLTLLGLGTQPDLWSCGIAAVPVADYVAAYEDEMEGLKAYDRAMFGGSPADVPEAYVRASPLTYIEKVLAPVLVLAGVNDPRCPLRQIENYLSALESLNKQHEVYRFDAGHGSHVTAERINHMRAELDFLARHLTPVAAA